MCLNPTLQCLNLRWQNSRWLSSPSWVRMSEFESVWISLNQSQSRVRMFLCESERKKQGIWIPKCRADSKIAEFQMAAIIKLGVDECVWPSDWISLSQSQSGGRVFLSESERRKQGVWIPQCRSWIQVDRIQDGCHHQVNQNELAWVRVRVEGECFWVNLREDNKVSESKMAVS